MSATLIPFPKRRLGRLADWMILQSKSREDLNRPQVWSDRPVPPDTLGNMLQRLVVLRPCVVLLIESTVAEILQRLEEPVTSVGGR